MNKVPIILIYSRLLLGILIVFLSLQYGIYIRPAIVILITIGLLTDIFDGIVARRLNVSTEKHRRLDSGIDQAFWIMVIVAAFVLSPAFFVHNYIKILLIAGLELFAYLLSFIKFRKEVATHAILSKIWVLVLFATLVQVIVEGNATTLFMICFYLGVITRFEIILILLIIRKWTNDVPSIYHAFQLRKGKDIHRNKWMNG